MLIRSLEELSVLYFRNPGQKTTGQKTTGHKTTKNANPGQKTTRTKDHQAGFSLEKSQVT